LTIEETREGVILGTTAYMSPEQARGRAVDKRTDIWSFGCVVFQMLTGHTPFGGETISDTMAAILEREPNWQAGSPHLPPGINNLLRRCLEKDVTKRLRDIGDARIEINDALEGRSSRLAPRPLGRNLRIGRWAAALVALVVLAAAVSWFRLMWKAAP